ncbi:ribosome-dependent mRNA interferase toxin YhaV [Paraburkholderia sabiae]|uniref:type II toxin-antitoxin system YhaV family toxin n=1 Tax=Paraburkholderia sabiae TaxID=273251 RepID=UPI001CAF8026|nr:type II toxin-antitoxin system YhaV family toxin [Paraburkholderia sabiae]CAG9196402.1 ribosome-dependent mRNA interferase toxin YhaV [Paraburkholderia sabiae]
MTIRDVLKVNGWTIYAHPCFLDQFESLVKQVEALRRKLPNDFHKKNDAKRLAAIAKLAWEVIPDNPEKEEYRQGETLGDDRKHWFRAKFFQQYRLFFRYHKASRIIILAWVNDETTRRAYGSTTDAYKVFARMLNKGRPPDDWNTLLAEASSSDAHEVLLSVHKATGN